MYTGILTLVEYVLLVPDSIARPPGRPAGLLASDSGTGPRIEANHTQAGLFTTVPLPHPDRHALFPLSWRGKWPDWLELRRRRPAAAAAATSSAIIVCLKCMGLGRPPAPDID